MGNMQNLLSRCTEALTWARMDIRAFKSRSFIVVNGRSINSTPFYVPYPSDLTDFSAFIPSIHSNPVRFLGRIIDGSLSDRITIDELSAKLCKGLSVIDKSDLRVPRNCGTSSCSQNSMVSANL